jgi:hypothetical protein
VVSPTEEALIVAPPTEEALASPTEEALIGAADVVADDRCLRAAERHKRLPFALSLLDRGACLAELFVQQELRSFRDVPAIRRLCRN